jgi:hypothetical protein
MNPGPERTPKGPPIPAGTSPFREAFRAWLLFILIVCGVTLALDGWTGAGPLSPPEGKGLRHFQAGRWEASVRAYRAGLSRNGADETLIYNLGTALLGAGQMQEAEGMLAAVLATEDQELRARTLHNLALIPLTEALGEEGAARHASAGRAAERAKEALRLSPSLQDTRWNLELALRISEETEDQATASDPEDPNHTSRKGEVSRPSVGLSGESLLDALQSAEGPALFRLLAVTLAGEGDGVPAIPRKESGPPW